MRKILAIAWKEVYTTFVDRNLILIMIATPLAISTIVGLAFGGLGGGDINISSIPVAVINHDQPNTFGVNYGAILTTILVPGQADEAASTAEAPVCEEVENQNTDDTNPQNVSLDELLDARIFDAVAAASLLDAGTVEAPTIAPDDPAYLETVARAAVDRGEYTALLIIPADFTAKQSALPDIETTGVTIYANSGRGISAGIFRSIIEGIVNQMAVGNIAIAATMGQVQEDFGLIGMGQLASSTDMGTAFACAFTPTLNTISLDRQLIEGQQQNASIAILVTVGSAQAMFFALFTAQGGVLSMYEERRNWTLQRLVISPTPRWMILVGKLIGVLVTVMFQLLLLLIALTIVGSIMQGGLALIWGTNIPAIFLTLVVISIAVSGLGMLLAGIVKTPEQGNIYGSVINIALAMLGGSFGFALPPAVAQFSLIYWGQQAFGLLSRGQSDIGLPLLILGVQGIVMFLLGVWLFNRRFDI